MLIHGSLARVTVTMTMRMDVVMMTLMTAMVMLAVHVTSGDSDAEETTARKI